MGTVYAKESKVAMETSFFPRPPPDQTPSTNRKPHKRDIDLKTVPVSVHRIHVDGLKRTKNDLVEKDVKSLFDSSNFEDMVRRAHEVKIQMDKLGIFKQVAIAIDTCQGPNTKKDGYEITFEVEESRPVTGGISTLVGTNEGSVLFGIKLSNLLGRAEKVSLQYQHGSTKNAGCNISFQKPLQGNTENMLTVGGFQFHGEYPWSGYKETSQGISTDYTVLSSLGSHIVRLEGVWREVGCLSDRTSLPVRKQAGNSLKSSLKHIFQRETRDNHLLPRNGSLLRLTQELAGLGLGDTKFIKHEVEWQTNRCLFLDMVLELSLAAGYLKSLSQDNSLRINDRLFLGGPLTLRGFNLNGIGPSSDGNTLGGDTYWQAGLHLYTPLPFRPGRGGIGDHFRTHFFLNTGNLVNLQLRNNMQDNYHQLVDGTRLSYGAGIVLRMGGMARLELNYCVPYRAQQGDSINEGLQFGIGLHFL